ncbi:MAG TPA: ATP-binding protein, partial [Methylophilaceae bacterium]|nr:ATP-binding protein [Methylophilaceae bacterium]
KLQKLMLAELIEEILANYTLTLTNKQIAIWRDFEVFGLANETIPGGTMLGDEEKLHTVIDNLISNAIKYTPQSGNIRISIKLEGKFAVIEVHDSGAGVLASDRASLFDPFYRGDGTHEGLVSGSGLGLSIAKEYVDAHGGEIVLLPSELGAHFRVRLPLEISPV